MKRKSSRSILRALYASSEASADVLYLSGVFVPDAFLCLIAGKRSIGIVSRLEYARVKSTSKLDEVLLLESVRIEAAKRLKVEMATIGPAELIRYFATLFGNDVVEVPSNFPAGLYAALQSEGIEVNVARDPFFPARELKTDEEAKAIRLGNSASAAGFRVAESVLKQSKIEGKRLKYAGSTLTSERLRYLIDQACLAKGALAQHTIVAGGEQACDPHETGRGPLRPNELIIIDIFPRIQASGYHGDMTRTFLKGRASDAQHQLVGAVRAAQKAAIAKVKAGTNGSSVHKAAHDVFEYRGYQTEKQGDAFVGFIHSTGHGLGLEVHEAPRVSLGAGRLRKGQVITIEPGLYYPGLGGCRIEDVLRVTGDGSEKLSSFHYKWELK
ncbi:MAG: Xaa-Pro peptidase family protein [Verrucomicrobiota bacterium]